MGMQLISEMPGRAPARAPIRDLFPSGRYRPQHRRPFIEQVPVLRSVSAPLLAWPESNRRHAD